MAVYVFVLSLIALVACEIDYGEYEPYCKNGQYDEEYIYGFLMGSVNDGRSFLVRGKQPNSYTKEALPAGEMMRELDWSCKLEQIAGSLLQPNCTDDDMPTIPENRTGFFFKMDINWTEPTLYTGVLDWLKEIQDEPVTYDSNSDAIRYSEPSKHRNYLNLVRRSITKMGCGGMYCYEDGMHKYRGLCLTNKPPLKDNEVVMKFGNGGCKNGENCPTNTICTEDSLCLKDIVNQP